MSSQEIITIMLFTAVGGAYFVTGRRAAHGANGRPPDPYLAFVRYSSGVLSIIVALVFLLLPLVESAR